ncbi:MAG: phage integrase N-terminal SAM-like domain-containing protein, partial [Ignavibacteriaceae bacterium]|nr:phage integrase N-terminal SAM-like domain-containing protein [Ignavibacteriaceae bacterium]
MVPQNSGQALKHTRPRLLEQVRTHLKVNHYSKKTEEAYIGWIKRYILFHN